MQKRTIKYIHSDKLLRVADKNPAVKKRATLVHGLIASYGLLKHVQLLQPKTCHPINLRSFHSRDYLQQLDGCAKRAKEAGSASSSEEDDSDVELNNTAVEHGLGFDCPIWADMDVYTCTVAGATMTACDSLCKSTNAAQEVVINWTGGWHHAHRDKAGGYCYVNDIVLGILVLRKRFQRILYVDLDVHHGDGVQSAFETTKRVFTLSFHQYECGFYPGTGGVADCGFGGAKGYAANFPYKAGITGDNYKLYFKRITQAILKRFIPDACFIQCGADAIVGDPLGGTNLTPQHLISCISWLLQQQLPTIILGGGGYHFANTSRYWTLLTAALCGQILVDDIPEETPQFLVYGPDYSLNIMAKQIKDMNTLDYLDKCAATIEENLQKYDVSSV